MPDGNVGMTLTDYTHRERLEIAMSVSGDGGIRFSSHDDVDTIHMVLETAIGTNGDAGLLEVSRGGLVLRRPVGTRAAMLTQEQGVAGSS
jgi:hypothetical protein